MVERHAKDPALLYPLPQTSLETGRSWLCPNNENVGREAHEATKGEARCLAASHTLFSGASWWIISYEVEIEIDVLNVSCGVDEHGTKHIEEIISYRFLSPPVKVTVDLLNESDFPRSNAHKELIGNHTSGDILLWLPDVTGHEAEAAC